jgi:hypothetical protein
MSKKIGFACYETIQYVNPNPNSITLTLKYGTLEEVKFAILRIASRYPDALPVLEEIIRCDYPQYLKVYNQIVLIS